MLIDANVLLRIFDGPDHPQHETAVVWLRDASARGQPCRVLPATLSEIAFVLSSQATGYGLDRAAVVDALQTILDDPLLTVIDAAACRRAVELYARYPMDLDDCYLAAAAEDRNEPVASFDGDFDRLRGDGILI